MTEKEAGLSDNGGRCEICNGSGPQTAVKVFCGGGLGWADMWVCGPCHRARQAAAALTKSTNCRRQRKPVIIESPYRGTGQTSTENNLEYLRRCIRDCIERGETPYASHRMLAGLDGALDDNVPEQRALGIEAGLDMAQVLILAGATVAVYVDHGCSNGMHQALDLYRAQGVKWEVRSLNSTEQKPDSDQLMENEVPLIWSSEEAWKTRHVITAEQASKWYTLWLVPSAKTFPSLRPVRMYYKDLEDTAAKMACSAFVDHVPNPLVLRAWCRQHGYHLDRAFWLALLKRWKRETA